jgi:hypothetical protein
MVLLHVSFAVHVTSRSASCDEVSTGSGCGFFVCSDCYIDYRCVVCGGPFCAECSNIARLCGDCELKLVSDSE